MFGYEPIAVETASGRAAYEDAQRAVAGRSCDLRARLITALQNVLAAAEQGKHTRADAAGIPSE
jgi:hypothetical protein